jgi:hypothetical protein
VNRFCSVFQQILKLFPRTEFDLMVRKHRAERHSRGFRCWDQFVAMMFCHLGRAQSLREIQQGLASAEGRLQHLGLKESPRRSTLSYANAHRPYELFESLFYALLDRCRGVAPKHKFRFKNRLLSLDASTIDLCASVFDWAKFRRTKGAVKLHMVLDHDGHLPEYCVITDGKTSDIKAARRMSFPAGSIVVFDRGYSDYLWFTELSVTGVGFVTRMKSGARYERVENRPVRQDAGVRVDQVIRLRTGVSEVDRDPVLFRRIEFVDAEGKEYVFVTNRLDLSAVTIAEIYRQRWQIETFFKVLKQNLRIKTFVGTSRNALHTQIWTALIAILVLKYMQLRSRYGWSLSNLVAMIRLNLFTYRDLWSWLDEPFTPPEIPPETDPVQLKLPDLGQQKGGLVLQNA